MSAILTEPISESSLIEENQQVLIKSAARETPFRFAGVLM